MRILILNQGFYPDVVSTAQHASDLAASLAERGHDLTVVSSCRAYDNPNVRFPKTQLWRGVKIVRVSCSGLGKGAKWRRAVDFATYMITSSLSILRMRRFDLVVAMTSPPLVCFLAALLVRIKGGRLVIWVMDLNPDEAVAAGWLLERSPITRCLYGALHYGLSCAERVIVLDRFMRQRIAQKNTPDKRIDIIPPWSHDHVVHYHPELREAFRTEHGLTGKFVVMYSGNHSPCHSLETLLRAAELLSDHPDIVFCFIGGGSEFKRVLMFTRDRELRNVICLPYQPLNRLSASLSAADLHVIVLGDAFVGIVHPCKIYNILTLRIPILYIGPSPSHVTDIVMKSPGNWACLAQHGDVASVVAHILRAASQAQGQGSVPEGLATEFSQDLLLRRFVTVLESAADQDMFKCEMTKAKEGIESL